MDFDKIFIKDCNPTKMGGQAVIEGIMMRGSDRMAIAVRRGDGSINVKETPIKPPSRWMKWPVIRGVVSFVTSLVTGTSTLMYSAEVLEEDLPEEELEEPGKLEKWVTERLGTKAAFNILLYTSVVFALLISIGVFVLLPTWLVGFCGKVIENEIALNLIEGVLRMVMFVLYILAISRMKDIQRVFQYHGAEHQTIHCYENGLELTPENCMKFERLHPRCGTSFLMFVLIISLLLFSFLGWPNLAFRILSRLLLIPVIAGISYEVLRWAGRSDNIVVKILSVPGLLMQKITTAVPDESQLQVAIVAVKACLMDRPPEERIYDVDSDGNPVSRQKTYSLPADTTVKKNKSEFLIPEDNMRNEQEYMEEMIPESPPSDFDRPQEMKLSLDDLFSGPGEKAAVTTDEIADNRGLWPGEMYAVRQQYLYDMNEIMGSADIEKKNEGLDS